MTRGPLRQEGVQPTNRDVRMPPPEPYLPLRLLQHKPELVGRLGSLRAELLTDLCPQARWYVLPRRAAPSHARVGLYASMSKHVT